MLLINWIAIHYDVTKLSMIFRLFRGQLLPISLLLILIFEPFLHVRVKVIKAGVLFIDWTSIYDYIFQSLELLFFVRIELTVILFGPQLFEFVFFWRN